MFLSSQKNNKILSWLDIMKKKLVQLFLFGLWSTICWLRDVIVLEREMKKLIFRPVYQTQFQERFIAAIAAEVSFLANYTNKILLLFTW